MSKMSRVLDTYEWLKGFKLSSFPVPLESRAPLLTPPESPWAFRWLALAVSNGEHLKMNRERWATKGQTIQFSRKWKMSEAWPR